MTVIGILLGSVLVVPLVLRPVSQALGRVTNKMARGVGEIAVLHLSKERSRSAYTLALVMVVMAMLFATGGLYLSVRNGIGEIVDRQFGADVFVRPRSPDDGTLSAKLAAAAAAAAVTLGGAAAAAYAGKLPAPVQKIAHDTIGAPKTPGAPAAHPETRSRPARERV